MSIWFHCCVLYPDSGLPPATHTVSNYSIHTNTHTHPHGNMSWFVSKSPDTVVHLLSVAAAFDQQGLKPPEIMCCPWSKRGRGDLSGDFLLPHQANSFEIFCWPSLLVLDSFGSQRRFLSLPPLFNRTGHFQSLLPWVNRLETQLLDIFAHSGEDCWGGSRRVVWITLRRTSQRSLTLPSSWQQIVDVDGYWRI